MSASLAIFLFQENYCGRLINQLRNLIIYGGYLNEMKEYICKNVSLSQSSFFYDPTWFLLFATAVNELLTCCYDN